MPGDDTRMPIYEYRCTDCTDFEQIHRMGLAPAEVPCPTCQAPARRRMSAPALSAGGTSAFRLIDDAARSAHEPQVVTSTGPGQRPAARQSVTTNPLHRKLPRP